MLTEQQKKSLDLLESTGLIVRSEKNLREKIESIVRSLESLVSKKKRIEYEIKKQRISLVRKREELKRVSKRLKTKTSSLSESDTVFLKTSTPEETEVRNLDSKLLQESDSILKEIGLN